MNEKQVKFFQNLQKTLEGGAVQPQELMRVVDALLKIIAQYKKLADESAAKTLTEAKAELTNLSSLASSKEKALRALVKDAENATTAELGYLADQLQREVSRVEHMIPSMPDLAPLEGKIDAAIAELERKIPNLPEELSAEGIRDKLETLEGEERLDKSAIRGIEELEAELRAEIQATRQARAGGGPNVNAVQIADLSSQCDGATKSFDVPRHRFALQLTSTEFPVIYRPTIDFTTANKTLTLTDEVAAPATGQTLVFLYVK